MTTKTGQGNEAEDIKGLSADQPMAERLPSQCQGDTAPGGAGSGGGINNTLLVNIAAINSKRQPFQLFIIV